MTDREKIRAEVERLKEIHEKLLNKPMERGRIGHAHGYVDCCDEILDFIDSIQQEHPEVDLEKEYEEYVEDDPVFSKLTNRNVGLAIARHFFELGLNARKV